MPKFLNTHKLIKEIPLLIERAQKELLIIVPYIQTSELVFKSLSIANSKGVEITIIMRGDDLDLSEKKKLEKLENLNLLSHPTVHSKCYMNEESVILTSINMYEASEKKNREMGVLINEHDYFDSLVFDDEDDEDDDYDEAAFRDDLLKEIIETVNSSVIIKKSNKTEEIGLKINLIKTDEERELELLSKLNKHFSPKKFLINQGEDDYWITCYSYINRFDLVVKDIFERIEFRPNLGDENIWFKKLSFLHKYQIKVNYEDREYIFTCYNNTGGRLNLVGYFEENFDEEDILRTDDCIKIWESAINSVAEKIKSVK